ncbi:hypothetical protein DP73_05780 [Desulfosporosinus sp. HMP52]|nr:hypothetical protein DP73_05780 [Desulfosporosinus sp. HMP52]
MDLFFILLALLAWLLSFILFKFAFKIDKETHKDKSVLDYTTTFSLSDWSIIGFIFDIIFSLTIGVILKYSPWWLAKTLVLIISVFFFILGVLAVFKIFT